MSDILRLTTPPSRHYLRCPFCLGYKSLRDDHCSRCGARCCEIVWEVPVDEREWSPELVMVNRRYW